jgi:hypothetical protein
MFFFGVFSLENDAVFKYGEDCGGFLLLFELRMHVNVNVVE